MHLQWKIHGNLVREANELQGIIYAFTLCPATTSQIKGEKSMKGVRVDICVGRWWVVVVVGKGEYLN